jgi:hypothetical protein
MGIKTHKHVFQRRLQVANPGGIQDSRDRLEEYSNKSYF